MRSAGASRRLQCDAPGLLCASVLSPTITLTSVFLFPRRSTSVAWRYQRGDSLRGVSKVSLHELFEWPRKKYRYPELHEFRVHASAYWFFVFFLWIIKIYLFVRRNRIVKRKNEWHSTAFHIFNWKWKLCIERNNWVSRPPLRMLTLAQKGMCVWNCEWKEISERGK